MLAGAQQVAVYPSGPSVQPVIFAPYGPHTSPASAQVLGVQMTGSLARRLVPVLLLPPAPVPLLPVPLLAQVRPPETVAQTGPPDATIAYRERCVVVPEIVLASSSITANWNGTHPPSNVAIWSKARPTFNDPKRKRIVAGIANWVPVGPIS